MPEASYLTIGKVVKRLKSHYPDLTVSKVRYLEDEGLIVPARTSGGYRLFSPQDVKRLETILYLQKTHFLPLAVIRSRLDSMEKHEGSARDATMGFASAPLGEDEHDVLSDKDLINKFHTIDRIPELLKVSVTFVRQLANAGIVVLKRSPQGRDLVDGQDFALIRAADGLRHWGIEPKNLRQYIAAANRESLMFEAALSTLVHEKGDRSTAETKEQATAAFNRIMSLTATVRYMLIKRTLNDAMPNLDL